jgi:hypothetical protein
MSHMVRHFLHVKFVEVVKVYTFMSYEHFCVIGMGFNEVQYYLLVRYVLYTDWLVQIWNFTWKFLIDKELYWDLFGSLFAVYIWYSRLSMFRLIKLSWHDIVCFKPTVHMPVCHGYINVMFAGLSEAQHGLLLLQCCGNLLPDELPTTRTDLAHKIWDTLHELGRWHFAFQCKIVINISI